LSEEENPTPVLQLVECLRSRGQARAAAIKALLEHPDYSEIIIVVKVEGIWCAATFEDMDDDKIIGALESAKVSRIIGYHDLDLNTD